MTGSRSQPTVMTAESSFRMPRILLPRPGIDLAKWAVIACDQYTSEPDYWSEVERIVGNAPSTLHLIFPEVYLGKPDAPARIGRIQDAMRRYVADGVFVDRDGPIYVERTIGNRVRRGLMLELDLEQYDYRPDSTSAIRPTEGTIVERIAPRLEVRRAAELELPHILVLIDDPSHTVIEPLGADRTALEPLYATELMQGGGHVAGYAVDASRAERAAQALRALASPQTFSERYRVPAHTPPMLFAVGDGNHSLATAKACWESVKHSVAPDHPSRYALVEVENIHDPALAFAPIHRLLFGVTADLRPALAEMFGDRLACTDVASATEMRERVRNAPPDRHVVGMVGPGARFSVVEVAAPASTLPVGTFQPLVDRILERRGAREIDYVHGDDALERLAMGDGCAGFHFPAMSKGELLRMVVREGPLPRKTFSMGESHEKRYYVEARRIR
jgi:hypothetical protein